MPNPRLGMVVLRGATVSSGFAVCWWRILALLRVSWCFLLTYSGASFAIIL